MRFGRPRRDQLHRAWTEAFADYFTDAGGLTEETLLARMEKNAVDYDLSSAAFDDNWMVGFTMIGVDDWQGELTAFDAGTGIVPEFRGRGLAREMFDFATPALAARGVTRFLLEVLRPNASAIRAYSKAGFRVTRTLECFELSFADVTPRRNGGVELRPVDRSELEPLADEIEVQPSWETGPAAIRRIPDEVVVVGAFDGSACIGATVYYPRLNWLMGTFVRRGHRRRGIATALLSSLVVRLRDTRDTIRLINVDGSDTATLALVRSFGFAPMISQYEMELRLA